MSIVCCVRRGCAAKAVFGLQWQPASCSIWVACAGDAMETCYFMIVAWLSILMVVVVVVVEAVMEVVVVILVKGVVAVTAVVVVFMVTVVRDCHLLCP